jgi:hypothetical protein
MEAILAGLIAAVISWIANGQIAVRTGAKGIVCLVPAVEEVSKTLMAVLFNSSIFMSHAVFGTVEAVYDTLVTKKTGVWAGLISYFGHMLFGLITLALFQVTGQLMVGVFGGYLVHLAWNWLVYKPEPASAINRRRRD